MTWPKKILSIKFETAPPSIIDNPIFETLFNPAKIIARNITAHAKADKIRANSGTALKIPKAAPEL